MSDTDEKYFQLPLMALSHGPEEDRWDTILSYSFVEVGIRVFHKSDPEHIKFKRDDFATSLPSDYDKKNNMHIAAGFGAQVLGITIGSLNYSLKGWQALSDARKEYEKKHGRDVEVRLKKDLIFEARSGQGISQREICLLAAVYSVIGAKTYPVRITRQAIQCRMLGYKSPQIMAKEIRRRTDKAKPITLRQINWTLDKLHERLFFARARANARQTFYSHRMTQEQLEAALIKGKSYSQSFRQQRLERNSTLMEKIKSAKHPIKVNSPIIVDTGLNQTDPRPVGAHTPSTGASTTVSTGMSTLIKTPLIETPLIETHSIKTPRDEGATAFAVLKDGEMKAKPVDAAFQISAETQINWEAIKKELGCK